MITRSTLQLTFVVVCGLACACSEPVRLIANTCGNGVIEPGEDCDGYSAAAGLKCGAPGTAHGCQYLCNPSSPELQCPAGDTCDPAGVCIASPGACGNGIVDGNEECDPTVPTSMGTCGAVGTAHACLFICSSSSACPTNAICARDGVCREPDGQFTAASSSPLPFPSQSFLLRDVDGDGILDLVDAPSPNGAGSLIVEYGAGDGTFPQSTSLSNIRVTAIGDVTGAGRLDFAFQTSQNGNAPLQMAVAQADRTLTSAPFPAFAVANPGATTDMWLPIHPVAGDALAELLHVSIGSGSATFAFDLPFVISSVTVAAPTTFPFFQGHPPPFSIADAINDPAVGGDEIAIGMPGTSTISVYTASSIEFSDGSPQVPATLVHDGDISLGSATLWARPQFADVNGDGLLDIIAAVNPGNGSIQDLDVINTGTGFGSAVADPLLIDCVPSASAVMFGGGSSVVFCGQVLGRGSNTLLDLSQNQAGTEAVFPDINRDGIPDMVLAGFAADPQLTVFYGSPSGLFSIANLPLSGAPLNLRVGDYNGDRIDDVLFFIKLPNGEEQYFVLYGTTDDLAAPVPVATLSGVTTAEAAVLAPNATVNPSAFPEANTDLVVSSAAPIPAVTELFGNANRTLTSSGFVLSPALGEETGLPVFGHFVQGHAAEDMVLPIQGSATGSAISELDVLSVVTDTNKQPINELPTVVASSPASAFTSFDVVICQPLSIAADFNHDGIDEVAFVSTGSPTASGCVPLAPPQLAVLQVLTPSGQFSPLPADLTGIQKLRAFDVDGDGNLDLLVMYQGNVLSCQASPCVPTGNGVAIIWGTPTGLGSAVSELVPPTAVGQVFDVALLPLSSGDPGHLIIGTETGVIEYEVGSNRTLAPGATISPLFAVSIATGDVNGDGLTDLVVDSIGSNQASDITVLFSQPKLIR